LRLSLADLSVSKRGSFLCFARLTDEIEMGVFVARFMSCVILFVLGLQAPGIMTTRDYASLSNSHSQHSILIDVS